MTLIDSLRHRRCAGSANPSRFLSEHGARLPRSSSTSTSRTRTLRREIQSLRAWRETARQLEEENAQLRALNNVRLARRTTFVTGDVFADSGGPFLESALVNVGREDGIADGAAAVDGAGLVGRVVGVGERASRLLLLTDFSSRVPVVIQPGARRAVLAGDGTSGAQADLPGRLGPGAGRRPDRDLGRRWRLSPGPAGRAGAGLARRHAQGQPCRRLRARSNSCASCATSRTRGSTRPAGWWARASGNR